MNKNVLSLLGCSGSLALALLTTQTATANTAPPLEFVFTAPGVDTQIGESYLAEDPALDCLCGGSEAQEAYSDEEGDLAISLYGCDCAGCRNLARNQIQEN